MITASHLSQVSVQKRFAKIADRILTADDVLNQEVFDAPEIISQRLSNFNLLLTKRCLIRDLKMLPLKEETLHDTYNALSREELLKNIKVKIGDEKMVLLLNEYPYQLTKDAIQCILWINEEATSRCQIIKFLARLMRKFRLDELDLVCFERSSISRSKYVKRSFPHMRHIHVWVRKSSLLGKHFSIE
jgi:hypothetical protein